VSNDKEKDDLDEFGIGGAARVEAPSFLPLPLRSGAATDADEWGDILGANVSGIPGSYSSGDDVLGALTKQSPAFKNYLAARLAKNRPVLQNLPRRSTYSLTFGPAVVSPGASLTIQSKAACRFRGQKLICLRDTDDLVINQVYVGQKNQLPPSVGDIDASAFAGNAITNGVNLDICEAGMFISVTVTNRGFIPRNFAMAIIGEKTLRTEP